MKKNILIKADAYNINTLIYYNDIKDIRKAVVFGHGFGGHKDNKAAERFANRVLEKNKGIAVITFDWPAHGSDVHKNLRLDDCMSYLEHVIAYAHEQLKAEELYGYATSFGGYLFLRYLSLKGKRQSYDDGENPASHFKKLALRNPAIEMYNVITSTIIDDEEFEIIMKGKPVLVGFDRKIRVDKEFLDELKESDITEYDYIDYADDILILQGMLDELVPPESVKRFADDNLIDYIPVERADHRFTDLNTMHYAINEIIKYFEMR